METIEQERLSQLRGQDLYDSDGDKVGKIDEIHLDDETGHVLPLLVRASGEVESLNMPIRRGLGGRASARPSQQATRLEPGDRLVMCSDGVIREGAGRAGLGRENVAEAALCSDDGSAADTVRKIHSAVLAAAHELQDDATVVCLAAE